jgi:hypothetical protein
MEKANRKKNAVKSFIEVFDNYLKDEDRVAFIRFNHNVNIVFELNQ